MISAHVLDSSSEEHVSMFKLKDIKAARKLAYDMTRESFNRGFVHGPEWTVLGSDKDYSYRDEIQWGSGEPRMYILKHILEKNTEYDNIWIEGRYDWSPSLYDYNRWGDYEPGVDWDVDLKSVS
jgi:hypothetical protein